MPTSASPVSDAVSPPGRPSGTSSRPLRAWRRRGSRCLRSCRRGRRVNPPLLPPVLAAVLPPLAAAAAACRLAPTAVPPALPVAPAPLPSVCRPAPHPHPPRCAASLAASSGRRRIRRAAVHRRALARGRGLGVGGGDARALDVVERGPVDLVRPVPAPVHVVLAAVPGLAVVDGGAVGQRLQHAVVPDLDVALGPALGVVHLQHDREPAVARMGHRPDRARGLLAVDVLVVAQGHAIAAHVQHQRLVGDVYAMALQLEDAVPGAGPGARPAAIASRCTPSVPTASRPPPPPTNSQRSLLPPLVFSATRTRITRPSAGSSNQDRSPLGQVPMPGQAVDALDDLRPRDRGRQQQAQDGQRKQAAGSYSCFGHVGPCRRALVQPVGAQAPR